MNEHIIPTTTIRAGDLRRMHHVVAPRHYRRVARIEKYGLRVKVWFSQGFPDPGPETSWLGPVDFERGDKVTVLEGM